MLADRNSAASPSAMVALLDEFWLIMLQMPTVILIEKKWAYS